MSDRAILLCAVVSWLVLSQAGLAQAQGHHHPGAATDTSARMHRPAHARHPGMPPAHAQGGGGMAGMGMAGTDMSGMDMGEMPMHGLYGPYPMSREASGTSWQPEAARHEGVHVMRGAWMAMLHGAVDLVYGDQDGARGGTKLMSSNMGMGMAQRPLGPGTLGLRAMLSLEPATIGSGGYPLLLQTGETSDGRTPLIDRQHPHDFLGELAGTYSVSSGNRSLFVYGGLPGEPALGPPVFMHRFSGASIPVAPITHHWLDSTHITFGVLTGGAIVGPVKLEASTFRGREPDQNRWDIETPRLDSHSFRLSVNPTERWALQASFGRLHSPEQLDPEVDQERLTASAMYEGEWGDSGRWEGLVAWGRDRNLPGHALDALTAEAALELADRHTLFARVERVQKDELFPAPDPRAGVIFDVGELTAGYRFDFLRQGPVGLGVGAAGTLVRVPGTLRDAYGSSPAAGLLFLHALLR